MHPLINNNLCQKIYIILLDSSGPRGSGLVRSSPQKRTRSGPRGSVLSTFEPVPSATDNMEPIATFSFTFVFMFTFTKLNGMTEKVRLELK